MLKYIYAVLGFLFSWVSAIGIEFGEPMVILWPFLVGSVLFSGMAGYKFYKVCNRS